MGVWMEAESTVTTVSQGINRPNGAYTALNFLGWEDPGSLSGNKLMGERGSDGRVELPDKDCDAKLL